MTITSLRTSGLDFFAALRRAAVGPIALLLLCATTSMAEDGIPLETVAKLKDATVYIKVEARRLSGSGSGFIIQVDAENALVVTNHHVIAPEVVEIVGGSRRGGGPLGPRFPGMSPRIVVRTCKDAKATVVLRSGTPQEESHSATVLAAEPEMDLAILKIDGVKKLPLPIQLNQELKLVETAPVYTFGFPFGKILATGKGSPAITIGKGSISSLRLDDDGQLALVQIDGALNPGNSGGPVVDNHGRLVGIAVATISNSSGIGLAIPANHLKRMLEGRLGTPHLSATKGDDGRMVIHVEVTLIDPLRKIRSAELHYIAAGVAGQTPKPNDRLSLLPGCRKLPLKIENQLAVGEFSPKKDITEVELIFQGVCTTSDDKCVVTPPQNQQLTLKPLPNRTVGPSNAPSVPKAPAAPNLPPQVDDSKDAETRIVGGRGGNSFTDKAPQDALLVGFEIGLGKWGQNDVIHAIRPIYRAADGKETFGQQHGTDNKRLVVVKAKEGYAVGSITTKSMALVDGFSVTFMKVGDKSLDKNDKYLSDWVGGKGGGPETTLGGDGRPIIGIIGREDHAQLCVGLGLLRKQ